MKNGGKHNERSHPRRHRRLGNWVVKEALENEIPLEEVKRKLDEHKEKAEKHSRRQV